MPNMSLTKVTMPEQKADVRNKNFDEVALGYTKEMAMEEATRCLNCKHQPSLRSAMQKGMSSWGTNSRIYSGSCNRKF